MMLDVNKIYPTNRSLQTTHVLTVNVVIKLFYNYSNLLFYLC